MRAPPFCRSCGAEISWAETINGKRIPLDRRTRSDGNLVRAGEDSDGTLVVRTLRQDEDPGPLTLRWVAHFATCPDRKEHRRRR
jgi:hypothetical protein